MKERGSPSQVDMIDLVRKFEKLRRQKKRPIKVYYSSVIRKNDCIFLLIREEYERKLVIIRPQIGSDKSCGGFIPEERGELEVEGTRFQYQVCPCNHHNASLLREQFSFTRPTVIGLTPAIGMGDRIGLATPGHIRAAKKFGAFPVLAQQSIREMTRTSRSPQEVMDDVLWAVFQEGYRLGFAADADHLKTEKDIDETFKVGFTMYTIDPSEYVDNNADKYDMSALRESFRKLPWGELKCTEDTYFKRYLGKEFRLSASDGSHALTLKFSEEDLLRAAVKYSAAIAHTAKLVRHLERLFKGKKFDLEISVDETETPTSPLEHLFIALELKRLNIRIQGLALRFVGSFEKAIDYIGDLNEFERTFRDHVLIASVCGPYKLSIHSGSDKFSIYPIIGRLAGDMIHLKTAGTSYLEALRVVARHDPSLFREIVRYSLKRFEMDRRTYHISTELFMVPDPKDVADEALEETYLNQDEGRQLLHVTFGSILTAKTSSGEWRFRNRIRKVLLDHEEEFYEVIASHFERHIQALGWKK